MIRRKEIKAMLKHGYVSGVTPKRFQGSYNGPMENIGVAKIEKRKNEEKVNINRRVAIDKGSGTKVVYLKVHGCTKYITLSPPRDNVKVIKERWGQYGVKEYQVHLLDRGVYKVKE